MDGACPESLEHTSLPVGSHHTRYDGETGHGNDEPDEGGADRVDVAVVAEEFSRLVPVDGPEHTEEKDGEEDGKEDGRRLAEKKLDLYDDQLPK